jgi:HlyD family secretion protein
LRNENTLRQKESAYKSADYSLQQAKNNLKNLEDTYNSKKETVALDRTSKENDLKSLQNTLKAQEATLSDTQRGPTEEDIALKKNDIALKELALAKAKEALDKYELRAPFDGIVSTLDFQVGDNLVADDTKYVYLQNPNLVQLNILLDQIDVVKVKLRQSVTVVFDALPQKTFSGSVVEIDPAPVETSGVVSYNATVAINKGTTPLFSGMSATATILIAEKKDALTVPATALRTRNGKSSVRKLVDGKPQNTPVTIGISDGQNTEIVEGLSEGDQVALMDSGADGGQNRNLNLNSSPQSQAQDSVRQIMRATGGGGGR